MAGIDDVLERLVTDASFKKQLVTDPKTALAGYDLTADDVELLATQVTDDTGGLGAVEQRTSKAGLFGLFSQLVGHGGSSPAGAMKVGEGALDDQGFSDPNGGGSGDDNAIIIVNSQPAPTGGGDDNAIVIVNSQPAPTGGGDAQGMIIYDAPAPQGTGTGADAVMFNPQPDPPGEPMLGGPDTTPGNEVGLAESSEMPVNLGAPGGDVGFGESSEMPVPGTTQGIIIEGGGEVGLVDSSEMPAPFVERGGGDVGFGESSEMPAGLGARGNEVGLADSSELPAPGAVSEGAVILESHAPGSPGEAVSEGAVIAESHAPVSSGQEAMGATIEELPAPASSGQEAMGLVLEELPAPLAPDEAEGIIIIGGTQE